MDGIGREVSGATSFIDKLSEGKYFFFIVNIFLLLDSCLVIFYGKNMLDLDFIIQSHISQKPISNVVIFTVSFLFIHNFLFNMVRYFLKNYIALYLYDLIPYLSRDDADIDYRIIIAVEHEAIRNQDKFTIERVKEAKESYFKMDMFDNEIFTFVCLLSINLWFIGSKESPTITQSLVTVLTHIDSSIIRPITRPIFYGIVAIFLWITVQGLIPKLETIYAPRTVNRGSADAPTDSTPTPQGLATSGQRREHDTTRTLGQSV